MTRSPSAVCTQQHVALRALGLRQAVVGVQHAARLAGDDPRLAQPAVAARAAVVQPEPGFQPGLQDAVVALDEELVSAGPDHHVCVHQLQHVGHGVESVVGFAAQHSREPRSGMLRASSARPAGADERSAARWSRPRASDTPAGASAPRRAPGSARTGAATGSGEGRTMLAHPAADTSRIGQPSRAGRSPRHSPAETRAAARRSRPARRTGPARRHGSSRCRTALKRPPAAPLWKPSVPVTSWVLRCCLALPARCDPAVARIGPARQPIEWSRFPWTIYHRIGTEVS